MLPLLFRGVGVVFYVQQGFGGSYFLGSGHAHAVQRVRNTQVLPLEKPQRVVRQNLDAAHGGQSLYKAIQPAQAVGVIGQAGNQHVADPEVHAFGGHILRHSQNVFIRVAGQLFVLFVVDLL